MDSKPGPQTNLMIARQVSGSTQLTLSNYSHKNVLKYIYVASWFIYRVAHWKLDKGVLCDNIAYIYKIKLGQVNYIFVGKTDFSNFNTVTLTWHSGMTNPQNLNREEGVNYTFQNVCSFRNFNAPFKENGIQVKYNTTANFQPPAYSLQLFKQWYTVFKM